MLFGFVFLADRLDLIDLGRIGAWWPLLPVVIGVARIASWQSADAVGSGVTWMLMGLWFWASVEGWSGLSWRNSWPLALAAIGTGMVVKALLSPAFVSRDESPDSAKEESHVG
jgi:hypothetical protein